MRAGALVDEREEQDGGWAGGRAGKCVQARAKFPPQTRIGALLHERNHGVVPPPPPVGNERKLVVELLGHLERRVHGVRGPEEEEWGGRVVLVDGLDRVLGKRLVHVRAARGLVVWVPRVRVALPMCRGVEGAEVERADGAVV